MPTTGKYLNLGSVVTEINDREQYKIKTNLNYSADMFCYDFDSLKIYKIYFTHNNYTNVVAHFKPKKLKNSNRNTTKRKTFIIPSNMNI